MKTSSAYEALCTEAERQGLRVELERAGEGETSRLSRLSVVDREGVEVGALRLGVKRDVERAAVALRRLLEHRRDLEARRI